MGQLVPGCPRAHPGQQRPVCSPPPSTLLPDPHRAGKHPAHRPCIRMSSTGGHGSDVSRETSIPGRPSTTLPAEVARSVQHPHHCRASRSPRDLVARIGISPDRQRQLKRRSARSRWMAYKRRGARRAAARPSRKGPQCQAWTGQQRCSGAAQGFIEAPTPRRPSNLSTAGRELIHRTNHSSYPQSWSPRCGHRLDPHLPSVPIFVSRASPSWPGAKSDTDPIVASPFPYRTTVPFEHVRGRELPQLQRQSIVSVSHLEI
jgi:hypothetical protein